MALLLLYHRCGNGIPVFPARSRSSRRTLAAEGLATPVSPLETVSLAASLGASAEAVSLALSLGTSAETVSLALSLGASAEAVSLAASLGASAETVSLTFSLRASAEAVPLAFSLGTSAETVPLALSLGTGTIPSSGTRSLAVPIHAAAILGTPALAVSKASSLPIALGLYSLACALSRTLILHIAACICILAVFLYVAFLRTSIFHLFFPCVSFYFLHSFLLYLNLLRTPDSLVLYLRIRSASGLHCLRALLLRNGTARNSILSAHGSLPCLHVFCSLWIPLHSLGTCLM